MVKHKRKKVASYKSRLAAQRKADALRREGHNAEVRRDSFGNFVVYVVEAVVVLSLLGAFFPRPPA